MKNNELDFCLINATADDLEFVKSAKISNIFENIKDVSDDERVKILSYVDRYMARFLKDFKIITVGETKCGCFLLRDYEDGVLLDEIFLIPEYREWGIGMHIINDILSKNKITYICVYKNNTRAIKLYKKLGFVIYNDRDKWYDLCYKSK